MVKNLRLLFVALLCAVFNVSMAQTYQTVSLPYEVNFTEGQGAFVIEDVENELGTDIWTQGSQYGMTATTFVKLADEDKKYNHDGESWLVSPIIDLSNASTASLAFTDQVNKFFGNIEEEISVNVREAGANTWTNLNVAYEKPSSTWGGWKDQVVNLSSYAGKKVQIGFHYIGKAATAGTYEVKSFAVTAEEAVVKQPAGLKYSESQVVVYLGEEPYELPTLDNPNNLPVTYTSNNEAAATVDANGNVTVVGEGNTTIKASFEGNDEFEEGSASYYLVVKVKGEAGTDVFELVTSADDLTDGDQIIIVNEANDQAMSKQTNNNRAATDVALESDGTIIPSTTVQVITLEGEAGAWYFNVGDGYLYAASTTGNQLKTHADADDKAKVTTLNITDGVATVKFNQWDTEEQKARTLLRFNPNNNNPIFSCYAETATTGTAVRIYKKPTSEVQKQPAGLEYSATEFTYTIGGENEAFPTLSNPNKLTVTYTSSDETVATVGRDGVVTPKAVGKTVIKAESEENDQFKAGSASYTLTVEEVFEGKTYELVTNANVLKAGDNIIIVSPTNDYAISTNQQKNNRTGVAVTLNEDNTITSTADVAAIVLGGEKDAWTFETNGGYLYAPATGNHLRTSAELPEAGGEAKITINAEGNADVEFNIEGQNMLRFNMNGTNENRLFSCYSATSSINTPVRIYREVSDEVEVEITEAGYATMYYGKKNLAVPAGVTATTWTADKDGMKVSKTYNANDIVPAGEAVVLQGEAGIYSFAVAEKAAAEPDANNMLLGFDDAAETVGPNASASYLFYILSTNKDGEEVGFYFKEDEGAAFVSAPHKAYLAVPADVAAGFYTFDGATDGINSVANVNAENNEVYSLSGVRMNGKLQKGIYIVNGKKVVIK